MTIVTARINTRTERREAERRQLLADMLVREMTALSRIAKICLPAVATYLVTAIESLDAAISCLSDDALLEDSIELDA